jgi:uncharacterized protein YbcI
MTDSPSELHGGPRAAAISNMVVRLVSEYTGRGPTQAWTHISEDLVSVVLKDTLTRGERSLVRDGREALVLSTRKAFQDAMREDLVAGIETITGREVEAFMSDNHIDPDVAVESFVLKPLARTASEANSPPA